MTGEDSPPDYDNWTLERLYAGRTLLEPDLRTGHGAVAPLAREGFIRTLTAQPARVNAAIVRKMAPGYPLPAAVVVPPWSGPHVGPPTITRRRPSETIRAECPN